MATVETLGQAAKAVYQDQGTLVAWRIIAESPPNDKGFYAIAYKNDATNEVIVSYRGTSPTDTGDLSADAAIFLGNKPGQFDIGKAFFDDVKLLPDAAGASFLQTGHSLGGAIAQYVAAQTMQLDGVAIPTVTFESPPLGSYAQGVEVPSVLNIRLDSDLIAQYSGFGGLRNVGQTIDLPDPRTWQERLVGGAPGVLFGGVYGGVLADQWTPQSGAHMIDTTIRALNAAPALRDLNVAGGGSAVSSTSPAPLVGDETVGQLAPPPVGTADPTRPPSADFITYTDSNIASLKQGGTLSDIVAIENNLHGNPITVDDLRRVNGLTPEMDTKLRVGQQLVVPTRNGDILSAMVGGVRMDINRATNITTLDYGAGSHAWYSSNNSLIAAIGYDSAAGEYHIATASNDDGTGTFTLSGLTSAPTPTADGKMAVDLSGGVTALIDPAQGTAHVARGGSSFTLSGAAGATLARDSAGNVTAGLGGGNSALLSSDGSGQLVVGDTVTTLPAGTQVVPASGGGFTVTPPAGEGLAVSGQGGSVVWLEPGQSITVSRDAQGGMVADLGQGRSLSMDAQGEAWLTQEDRPAVLLPSGTAANVVEMIAMATGGLSDAARDAVAAQAGDTAEVSYDTTIADDASSYAEWLESRSGTDSSHRDQSTLALIGDPSALALFDTSLARADGASTADILAGLDAAVKGGLDLTAQAYADAMQNIARQLGIEDDSASMQGAKSAGQKLQGFISTGAAVLSTISSLRNAVEQPTLRSVAAATHQLVSLGVNLSDDFTIMAAEALGFDAAPYDMAEQLSDAAGAYMAPLLAGAGAALSVIAAIDNPTPTNVAGAANAVTTALNAGNPVPAVAAIASAIGFVENPSFTGGLNTALWVAATINPAFIPVAAAVTVVESIVDFFSGGKPIVLDMTGQGINLISVDASHAFYDLDGNGTREHLGWIGAGNALLAFDADNDGAISGRSELSFLDYKTGAQTDLDGLISFDSNGDGKLSSLDANFARFKVWQDADGDGMTDAGEVKSLSEVGIASLTLSSDHVQSILAGNTVFGKGTFTRTDGSTGTFADVELKGDGTSTSVPGSASAAGSAGAAAATSPARFDDALVLNLVGGPVHTLSRNATSVTFDMDGKGGLERTGWIAPDSGFLVRGLGANGQVDGAAELVASFADLAALDANQDGKIDASDPAWSSLRVWVDKSVDGVSQKNELYTLAQLGIASIAVASTAKVAYDNGNQIRAAGTFAYTDGSTGRMAVAALGNGSGSGGASTMIVDGGTVVTTASGQVVEYLDGGVTIDVGGTGVDTVVARGGGNVVSAGSASNVLLMSGGGSDTLKGGSGSVTLVADGGDTLMGGSGTTTMLSGGSSNILIGGSGVDTASYDGNAGPIAVDLAAGTVTRDGGIVDRLSAIDVIRGSGAADIMTGDGGANTFIGGASADVLAGLGGADRLEGGGGNDVYVFGRGYGSDVVYDDLRVTVQKNGGADILEFGSGIAVSDVTVGLAGNDLVVGVSDPAKPGVNFYQLSDRILLKDWLNPLNRIESFRFADGTVLDVAGIMGRQGTSGSDWITWTETALNVDAGAGDDEVTGGAFADTLSGGAGNDILNGGAGNDTLDGGSGRDVYIIAQGGGADQIHNQGHRGDGDKILFQGSAFDQLWFQKSAADLKISVIGTSDSVTVTGWFADTANHVSTLGAKNSMVLSDTAVQSLVAAMATLTPPPIGQTTLTATQHQQLDTVIAASWQKAVTWTTSPN